MSYISPFRADDLQRMMGQYELGSYEQGLLALINAESAKRTVSADEQFGPYLLKHHENTSQQTKDFLLSLGFKQDTADKMASMALHHDGGKVIQVRQKPSLWRFSAEKPSAADKLERQDHGHLGKVFIQEILDALKIDLDAAENHNLKKHMAMIFYGQQTHHERMNGSGPLGMSAPTLCPAIRIFAIIDTLDGKLKVKTPEEAFAEMRGQKHAGEFDLHHLEAYEEFYKSSHRAAAPHQGQFRPAGLANPSVS